MVLSIDRIKKARESGYNDDQIIESIQRRDQDFGSRIQKAREAGYDSSAIMQSIEKRLNQSQSQTPNISSEDPNNINDSPKKTNPIVQTSNQGSPASVLAQATSDTRLNDNKPTQSKSYQDRIKPQELTPDQLKNMSISEKRDYIEDLNRYREFQTAKGSAKGFLSGVTFGLSEKIPAFKPQEDEHGNLLGEFLGSVIPIEGLAKVVGYPLIKLAGKSPIYKSGLEAFARMTGMGLTGAAYEGTKEAIKNEELPTTQELAKYGAQWAAIDGALQSLGYLGRFSKALRNSEQPVEALNKFSKEIKIKPEEFVEPSPEVKQKIDDAINKMEARNESIQISPKKLEKKKSKKKNKKPEVNKPIIEETGKSATDQIEQPKTRIDKIIDTSNDFIKSAKTPKESLKKLGQATNEAIFNVMAPLERAESLTGVPIAERVSTKIKFAQSAASDINSVLENGIFSNITGKFEHGSLKEAYGELPWKKFSKNLKPGEYSLEELNAYRTAKISLRRQSQGKKTGVDTKLAQEEVAKFEKKYGQIDQNIREFQKATLKYYGRDLIGDSLINQWNKDYYSPLYRVMDSGKDSILKTGSLSPNQPFKTLKGSKRKIIPPSESDIYNASMLIRNSKKNEAVLQYKQLVEKGRLPGKIKRGKNEPIPEEVLRDLDIDPSSNELAENLYNQTRKESFTPRKNILKGWQDGKPFEIEVPDDIYKVFSTLAPQDYGLVPQIFAATNRLFSKAISLAPRKFLSIVGRDALSSLIYSKTGSNPISVVEALGDVYKDKEVYKQFLSLGGDVYASRLAERIDRAHKVEDLITPGKDGILVPFEKMGEYFRKYSDTLSDMSLAVPFAEYKRALKTYGDTSEGRILAAMEARRVTYDPTRRGGSKIVKELGNFIPFWNVSLQDMAMLGRNLKTREAWVKGITAITLPTMALKMMNEDNPDYQDLNPVDKAAFWHIYAGDKHIRIPIPWLLGTTFKVGPEMFYEIAKSRGSDGWDGLYHNFVDNLSGDLPPLMQAFSQATVGKTLPSPLGTILGTETNAPDVVPRRVQHLPYEEQYTSKTSQLARWFGNMWGVSPAKLETVTKTMGGLVAADALALVDEIAYQTGLAEDKRPEQRESNYLLLGNFVSDSTPTRTKYANQFYEYLDEYKRNKASGKPTSNVNLNSYNSQISKKFREYRDIESSNISPRYKKESLKKKQQEINALYKEAVQKVQATPR